MSDPRLVDRILAHAHTAAASLRVRSALNPMLWLCAVISPLSFGLAYLFGDRELLAVTMVCIGSAPIVATILGFFYFMVSAPEKLSQRNIKYDVKRLS